MLFKYLFKKIKIETNLKVITIYNIFPYYE